MPLASLTEIKNAVGREVGVSSWILVDQARIDAFADATEDRQFIHVDPAAAAQTPFGGTIAHGFLSLSLLSAMGAEAMLVPDGIKIAINYGLDRVRFLAPVRSGSRVRRGSPRPRRPMGRLWRRCKGSGPRDGRPGRSVQPRLDHGHPGIRR